MKRVKRFLVFVSLITLFCNRVIAFAGTDVTEITDSIGQDKLIYDDNMEVYISEHSDEEITESLKSIGIPDDVLDNLSDACKDIIFNNIDENSEFEDYVEKDASTNNNSLIGLRAVELSSSNLQYSVTTIKGSTNGEIIYTIIPSFKWKISTSLGNDGFGFALYTGWEAVADMPVKLTMHLYNSQGTIAQTKTYSDPSSASQYGYGFKIPKSDCNAAPGGTYEGVAIFRARKKKSNATNSISLNYLHDKSSLLSLSYSISLGVGSVAFSNSNSSTETYGKNISFNIK